MSTARINHIYDRLRDDVEFSRLKAVLSVNELRDFIHLCSLAYGFCSLCGTSWTGDVYVCPACQEAENNHGQ
jgi:hypothetical protein